MYQKKKKKTSKFEKWVKLLLYQVRWYYAGATLSLPPDHVSVKDLYFESNVSTWLSFFFSIFFLIYKDC